MDDYLKIYEVGPRDGLQNESTKISSGQKALLIEELITAGLRDIEITSFVHPKAVPQMADADLVMRTAINRYQNQPVNFIGLVFNERGYDRAISAGAEAMAFGVSVSDTFSRRNTRMSAEESFQVTSHLIKRAKRDGVWIRVYLSAAWICPYEGIIPPRKTVSFAERVWALGIDELAVADTVGQANPLDVGSLMEILGRRLDMRRLAIHLHDTQALGLANATTALQAGVRIFDSSIGGLGGCPFAPGAAGNLATEDLVFLAYKLGLGTGVDFDKLWDIILKIEQWIDRPIGGRIRQWWESMCRTEPAIDFQ